MPPSPALPLRRHLALTLPLVLAACGGGGGDGGDATTDARVSTGIALFDLFFVESFAAFEGAAQALVTSDPRYLAQRKSWYIDGNDNDSRDPASEPTLNAYPLLSSGVHYAHAAGLTGAGAILSIIDNGFRQDHEVFAGKSITAEMGLAVRDHGTLVASVAAGNSATMIGMAPGAGLAFGSYDSLATLAAATRRAETLGAVAQNNSWGFTGTTASTASHDFVFDNPEGQDYLAALRSYARSGVVIFAAENDNLPTAGLMPALPALEPGLEAGWLAVVNGDADLVGDDIVAARRLSGACLEAAAWCLAAEGTWTGASAAAPDSYAFVTGTSFAAPMVAGAMAILAEAFPTLTPHELRIRLLASADNSFAGFTATRQVELVPGFRRDISAEWGHGFLDVKAALLPIGRTTATMADGSTHDLAKPLAVDGLATGDAVARSLAGVSLAVDDALSARFEVAADSLVARRRTPALGRALQARWTGGGDTACCGVDSWFPGTRRLRAAGDGLTLDLALPPEGAGEDSAGVMVGTAFASGLGEVALRFGVGRDGGALLPRFPSEAGSPLAAAELALAAPLGAGASLELAAGIGAGGGSALTAASAALVTRGVFGAGDRLALTVGLPVAVADGGRTITLPVATRSGEARQSAIAIDLAPDDREMRVGIEYHAPVAAGTSAFVALAHAENHGNVAGARDTGLFLGLRARF